MRRIARPTPRLLAAAILASLAPSATRRVTAGDTPQVGMIAD